MVLPLAAAESLILIACRQRRDKAQLRKSKRFTTAPSCTSNTACPSLPPLTRSCQSKLQLGGAIIRGLAYSSTFLLCSAIMRISRLCNAGRHHLHDLILSPGARFKALSWHSSYYFCDLITVYYYHFLYFLYPAHTVRERSRQSWKGKEVEIEGRLTVVARRAPGLCLAV